MLILVVLMLRWPVARQFGAGVAYLLWAIPVVRLFLPPLPTPFSILGLGLDPVNSPVVLAEGPSAEPVVNFVNAGMRHTGETPPAWEPAAAEAAMTAPTAIWANDLLTTGLILAAAASVSGAVILAARSFIAQAQFMATVDREAVPVSAPTADLLTRLAAEAGLRRPPRIVASLISRGPFVTGLFRPVIVMPAWFEDDYTPMEARAALLHELMHVRRGDLWAAGL